jgi:deoxyribonuclease-4
MNIGLHLRLESSLKEVFEEAIELKQRTFQTFFSDHKKGFYIASGEDKEFLKNNRHHFDSIFIHGSYAINLANNTINAIRAFEQEAIQALELNFDYMVIHPGARSASQNKDQAIDHCARQLNLLLKKYPDIKIVLENVAHAKKCIGGDFSDLRKIFEKCERPEQLFLCLDTAHAFAWGYSTGTELIEEFKKLLFIERLALIHLNDSMEKYGSNLDRHALPGNGLIPKEELKKVIENQELIKLPKILEIPVLEKEARKNILHTIHERLQ